MFRFMEIRFLLHYFFLNLTYNIDNSWQPKSIIKQNWYLSMKWAAVTLLSSNNLLKYFLNIFNSQK